MVARLASRGALDTWAETVVTSTAKSTQVMLVLVLGEAERLAARVSLIFWETAVAAAWFFTPWAAAAATLSALFEAEQAWTILLTLSSSCRQ